MAQVTGEKAHIHEYTSAADPSTFMKPLPVVVLPPEVYEQSGSCTFLWDNSKSALCTAYPATSPNLLAGFVRIEGGETHSTEVSAASQAFYVVKGSGSSKATALSPKIGEDSQKLSISWKQGDLFVLPALAGSVDHSCSEAADSHAILYWVSDAPLLSYLGVTPSVARIDPAIFHRDRLLKEVERVRHEEGSEHRNRMGILLANARAGETKTLSHTLWALLNVLPAGDAQPPHRHNSVALDLAVAAPASGGVYTLMSPELDAEGRMVDPIRAEWVPGAAFLTPPGWWHSHVNETEEDAWVLPMQDAGLYTHQRTLDIRFAPRKAGVGPAASGKEGAAVGSSQEHARTLAASYVVGPITRARAGEELDWRAIRRAGMLAASGASGGAGAIPAAAGGKGVGSSAAGTESADRRSLEESKET